MIKRIFGKKVFFNKFKLQKLINKSEFSEVYQGINIISKELVSIKIENSISANNFLESEAYYLFTLKGFGIPNLISYGKSGKYNILVEELLGPSLKEISKLEQIKNGFPIKDICMIALQGLDRLEYIHSKNIIHRDIKPQNFLIGRKDATIIYLIDYGLVKKYKSSRTGKFIKFTNLGKIYGSMAYSSINANLGYEQCRRDDLESFGYMLVSLVKKGLPWMKIRIKNNQQEKVIEVGKLKKWIYVEKVCEGLPEEFIDYINYSRKLEFEQEPNYNYLRNLFTLILIKENQKNDLKFFWINKKNSKSVTKNNENNYIMKRDTHKRLYNSVKKSLEKKRKEGINKTLKSDYSRPNNSLDEIKDIQNNKKGNQKINLTYKNFNIKSLYYKKQKSINNHIIERALTTPGNDEQKYNNSLLNLKLNKFISKKDSYNNMKNKLQIMKIKYSKNIPGYARRKTTFNNFNKNFLKSRNVISKNYCNLENNIINNYQNKKINININNYYYKEIGNQTASNNCNYTLIPEIHYRKLKFLDNKNRFKNYTDFSFQNNSKNIRIPDNKNKLENHSIYSFQNNSQNIRTLYNKNKFENHSIYSIQNNSKNIRMPMPYNENNFENHSIYSFQNNSNNIITPYN